MERVNRQSGEPQKLARGRWGVRQACVIFWLALLPGCADRPEMVEVEGRVTYQGQPPPAAGVLFFAPIEDFTGAGARPATAEFGTDGKFVVSSFANQKGLKPGRYRVTVQIWKERPQGFQNPGVNLVPPDYRLEELALEPGVRRVEVAYDVAPTD